MILGICRRTGNRKNRVGGILLAALKGADHPPSVGAHTVGYGVACARVFGSLVPAWHL